MKYLKTFLPVLVIAILSGVYFGLQPAGFLSKETDVRGPASPQTELEKLFSEKVGTEARGVTTMTSSGGEDYCDLIQGIDTYKVELTAEGVTSGDENIKLSISGGCNEQARLIVFDTAICKASYQDILDGYMIERGAVVKGFNLDINIPVKKLVFYISKLEVIYKDSDSETVELQSLNKIKMFYTCNNAFQP